MVGAAQGLNAEREVLQGSWTTPVDDMDDGENMPAHDPLRTIVQYCQQTIWPSYVKADQSALRLQEKYRKRATAAALLGSVAVALAIIQLYRGFQIPWSWIISSAEGTAAVGTFAIIFLGIRASLKEEWLLQRFKAESLRLLKFRYIIESGQHAEKELRERLEEMSEEVEKITCTTASVLQGWLARGTVPRIAVLTARPQLTKESLHEIAHYYRAKRLRVQLAYLRSRVQNYLMNDRKTRLFGPSFFFGSVAFVLAHLLVEIGRGPEAWSRATIMIAALLPVAAAGFRTQRASNEFARSASRSEALQHVLTELSERLRRAEGGLSMFQELEFCEQVLEADLREWMRLMAEAEWFG